MVTRRIGGVYVEVGLGGRVGPDSFFDSNSIPNAAFGLSGDGTPANLDAIDSVPSEIYAGPIAFDILLGPHPPSSLTLDDGNDFATVTWTVSPIPAASDRFSVALFFTANNPPQYQAGTIGASTSSSSGDLPSPLATPEPASSVLTILGLLGNLSMYRRHEL